jgi:VWFA-related protein
VSVAQASKPAAAASRRRAMAGTPSLQAGGPAPRALRAERIFAAMPKIAALIAAAACYAQAPPDAKPGVTLRTTTTLVQVRVTARDANGRTVTDLKKEDIEIFDDGIKQKVAVFAVESAESARPSSALSAFPEDKVDAAASKTGYAAILLDFGLTLDPLNLTDRVSISETIKMLKRADIPGKLGLFLFDMRSLKIIADFGTDKETLLEKMKHVPAPALPWFCFTRESCAWMRQTLLLQELELMADKLSLMPGRKALIWCTRGYDLETDLNSVPDILGPDPRPDPAGAMPKLRVEIERVIRKLNNADVAVYPIDDEGLPLGNPALADRFAPILKDYAARTGGVAFTGRNDLDVGIEQAAAAVRTVYSLGFYPDSIGDPSKFHRLEVKVSRPGVTLSYRQGYSLEDPATMPVGELAKMAPGAEARALAVANLQTLSPALQELQILARAPMEASAGAAMSLPFFYTGANVAVVDLALEIGLGNLRFHAVEARQRAELNLVAAARRSDGAVAAQFSDTVKLDFATEAEAAAFLKRPYRYERQFRLAPGKYEVRVAYGSGEGSLGTAYAPLTVDGWDGKALALSGIALARETRRADAGAAALDARKALVARGVEIVPAGDVRFRRGEPCSAYFEIHDPLRGAASPPKLSAQVRVLDQSGAPKVDSGALPVDGLAKPGEQMVPVSLSVPVDGLPAGKYKLEVSVMRADGDAVRRVVDFEVKE